MDKILFVSLFGMLIGWLYSVCNQGKDLNCTNDKNRDSSGCENETETKSPGYEVENRDNPCS